MKEFSRQNWGRIYDDIIHTIYTLRNKKLIHSTFVKFWTSFYYDWIVQWPYGNIPVVCLMWYIVFVWNSITKHWWLLTRRGILRYELKTYQYVELHVTTWSQSFHRSLSVSIAVPQLLVFSVRWFMIHIFINMLFSLRWSALLFVIELDVFCVIWQNCSSA
jgi:hypothetical protein